MFMDKKTYEALDFQYILNKIEVLTPYGLMYKNRMKPFLIGEEEELKGSLNILESYIPFIEDLNIRRAFNNILSHFKDLRNSIKRASEDFTLSDVELFEIKNFLFLIRDLYKLIDDNKMPIFNETKIERIISLENLLDPESTNLPTFYIYDNYSEELLDLRMKKSSTHKEIKEKREIIKDRIKEELNISLRPDNSVVISKDKKELLEKIENYPYLTYSSETYMNVKFVLKPTEKVAKLERQWILLKEQEERVEENIRLMLSKEIGKRRREIYGNMVSLGKLDLILAKAKLAIDMKGVKPNIVKEHKVVIEDGRHPKVEEFLIKRGNKFTPISIDLEEGVCLITGANMGGKTISLKLIGLLTAMGQYGLYVPAKEMTLGLNKYIKTSIGDMQSTDSGLSTFGGEIEVVSEAIKRADEKGLILIDELARGTNPEEGYAISKAITTYLLRKPSITLLTTHYDNIGDMDEVVHLQVVGLSKIDFEELKDLLEGKEGMDLINQYMDYTLVKVEKTKLVPKDAINIARIMGLDGEIIEMAIKIIDS